MLNLFRCFFAVHQALIELDAVFTVFLDLVLTEGIALLRTDSRLQLTEYRLNTLRRRADVLIFVDLERFEALELLSQIILVIRVVDRPEEAFHIALREIIVACVVVDHDH